MRIENHTVCSPFFQSNYQTHKFSVALINKINFFVLAVFCVLAISIIPVAKADKFTECIDNCDRNAEGALAKMICYGLCAVIGAFVK
jgi:hypothetical protein